MDRKIDRVGVTTGRWPKYRLVVDGVDLGQVRRVIAIGRDGLMGRSQPRGDGWEISGVICMTREDAEKSLIERAVRFGYLKA